MKKKESKFVFSNSDWGLVVLSAENGFVVKTSRGDYAAIEMKEQEGDDEGRPNAGLDLLWYIIDFFNLRPSRYAKERPFVSLEAGDKYVLKKGEKLVKKYYYSVE